MKVLVCGGRDYTNVSNIQEILDALKPTELAYGDATGADYFALCWANSREVSSSMFVADWKTHGRAAGPIRNQLMLETFKPDLVVGFPGGRGTADMLRRSRAAGYPVLVFVDG